VEEKGLLPLPLLRDLRVAE